MDRLVRSHVTQQQGDQAGGAPLREGIPASGQARLSYSCTSPSESLKPLSTPLVVDTSISFPGYQHALVTSPARIASLGSPTSPSWLRGQGTGSLPLRSPKRTISFDVPSDWSPEKFAHIHRQVTQMASAAGTADSVKITEGSAPEEEEIPYIQLQAPPKPKAKRQLSVDSSPPLAPEGAPSADRSLHPPVAGTVTQGNAFAPSSPTRQSDFSCGTTASLLSQSVKCPVPISTLPCEASRSRLAPDAIALMSDAMSPKRLRSEHGSVPCTPTRSLLSTPASTDASPITTGQHHPSTPTPKSGKRNKTSDIVFVFPEMHKEEIENSGNEDDELIQENRHAVPAETSREYLSFSTSFDPTYSGSHPWQDIPSGGGKHDTSGFSAQLLGKKEGSLSSLEPMESSESCISSFSSYVRTLKDSAENSPGLTSQQHSPSYSHLHLPRGVAPTLQGSSSGRDEVDGMCTSPEFFLEAGRYEVPKKSVEFHDAFLRIPALSSQNTAETKTLKTSVSDSAILEARHRIEVETGRPRQHERHLSSASVYVEQEPRQAVDTDCQQPNSHLLVLSPQRETQDAASVFAARNKQPAHSSKFESAPRDVAFPSSSNQAIREVDNLPLMSSSFKPTTPQVTASSKEDGISLSDLQECESRTARLCKSNPFTFTEKACTSSGKTGEKLSPKSLRLEHVPRQNTGLPSSRFADLSLPYQVNAPYQPAKSYQTRPEVVQTDLAETHWNRLDDNPTQSMHVRAGTQRGTVGKPLVHDEVRFFPTSGCRSPARPRIHRNERWSSPIDRLGERIAPSEAFPKQFSNQTITENRSLSEQALDSSKTEQYQGMFQANGEPCCSQNYQVAEHAEYQTLSTKAVAGQNVPDDKPISKQSDNIMRLSVTNRYEEGKTYYDASNVGPADTREMPFDPTAILEERDFREQTSQWMLTPHSQIERGTTWLSPAHRGRYQAQLEHGSCVPCQPHAPAFAASSTTGYPTPGCTQSYLADGMPSDLGPRPGPYVGEQADMQSEDEDDTVFYEYYRDIPADLFPQQECGFFQNSVPPHLRNISPTMSRQADVRGSEYANFTPRSRPTLRSHSNVEQSPNQAELEEMARFKYLRSFSEHTADPVHLVKQRRALSDSHNKQRLTMHDPTVNSPRAAWLSSEARKNPAGQDRHHGARRQLFADGLGIVLPDCGNVWSPLCYPTRSQSFSGAQYLRPPRPRHGDPRGGDDKRKSREAGDLDVRLECCRAEPAADWRLLQQQDPYHRNVACRRIDRYIQQILDSHRGMRPSSNAQGELDVWLAQDAEVWRLTQEASCLISKLGQHHRVVSDVTNGSVVIRVNCRTLLGVIDLWQLYESGALQGLVNELFGGDKLQRDLHVTAVRFRVSICRRQYQLCLEELASSLSDLQLSKTLQPICAASKSRRLRRESSDAEIDVTSRPAPSVPDIEHQSALDLMTSSPRMSPSWRARSPSTPGRREGRFSFGDILPRKAFSELNLSDGEAPGFASKKKSSREGPPLKENAGWSPAQPARLCLPVTVPHPRWRKPELKVFDENSENFSAQDILCLATGQKLSQHQLLQS